jgi:hypothetical protein
MGRRVADRQHQSAGLERRCHPSKLSPRVRGHPAVVTRSYGSHPAGVPAVPGVAMLTHRCLDPQDPYAEREVRVAFEWAADHPRLIAALDEQEADILPDLVEAQRDDLCREIMSARLTRRPVHPARRTGRSA